MTPMKVTADGQAAIYEPVEDWMDILVRQEQMKKMPRPMLETHLSLLGWYPVKAARAALQRGSERLFIIVLHEKGRTTVGYSEFSKIEQESAKWSDISAKWLRSLAQQAARHP